MVNNFKIGDKVRVLDKEELLVSLASESTIDTYIAKLQPFYNHIGVIKDLMYYDDHNLVSVGLDNTNFQFYVGEIVKIPPEIKW